MKVPSESQWARYSVLCARLAPLPPADRAVALQALRGTGEDPQVLSLVAVHCALPPDAARLRTGERLGNFTLEDLLGAGGMGVVYRAQQHLLGGLTRPVAVKLIHPALLLTARAEAVAQFQAELSALVKLEHTGIARVYDAGLVEDPGTPTPVPYLAMELVRGGQPLTTYATEYALPWSERLALLGQVCRAVAYAHEHRVVHRDLKPANILVDREGRPVIIDFGLAQASEALLPGGPLAAAGTPAYMSPEQVSEAWGEVSAKSDVYALGLILYELLAGALPYRLSPEGTWTQWHQVMTTVTPPPLGQGHTAYGGELEALVAAALAKRPADRPRVDVLRARLERALQQHAPERARSQLDTLPAARDQTGLPPGQRGPAAATPEETHARTPLASTPPHLAEKIRASRAALEGERKQVTVLFADLTDSLALIRDLDPEAAQQLLDPAIHIMMDAVHRYDGTVNQVLGDGIMALFGAPIAHEDHAVRACYAALAMRAALRDYAAEVRRTHGLVLQSRMGLNSGDVVVRTIRNDLHMDYSAVGLTTHLAARMEQAASPDTILLMAATVRLVEGLVQLKALGARPVKGLATPVDVWELLGASGRRRRLQTARARGLTHFVGRQTELAALHTVLAQAGAGLGQVVAVVGEAGVGKSRLVDEFVQAAHTQGWLVLESAAVSYGQATPYFPVLDLLRGYCHLEEGEDTRTIQRKVTEQVQTLDAALHDTPPALLALLDALPTEHPFWQDEASQRRQQTFTALKRLLVRESQRQPLLLVVEDLLWLDTETQALLDSLVESLATARLLLLVNYRPEYQHGWGSKTYYTQLRLDPLSPEHSSTFLQALVGDNPSVAPLKALLIPRTEGNPFFLEESVRTMVETGTLVGKQGAYRVTHASPAWQMPATVQAVLAARIDRLPPEAKRLLQTAAVIGTEVPWPLLQTMTPGPETALHRGLAHLQAVEFLYETRLFPTPAYTFKHVLTHEVAYHSLLLERRRVLHARIVEAMEALAGDRVIEQVERLTHHALRGEVWDKVLTYGRQAGEKGMARSAHREAVGYFELALTALSHLPETRDTRTQAVDLRLALRSALTPSDNAERILAVLHEAEALASALNDPGRLGQVALFLSLHFHLMGMHTHAVAAGQRALALATTSGEVGLSALAHFYLGLAYEAQGNYRRAMACLRQTVGALDGARRHERFGTAVLPAVASRAWLAACHAELGMFTEGSALGEEGLRLAEEVDHPASLLLAVWGIGLLALRQGALARALPLLERAMSLCQHASLPIFFPLLAQALGAAYTLSGRVADAVSLLTQAMEQTLALARGSYQTFCHLPLGEAHMWAGRLEEAQALVDPALALARKRQEGSNQAYALRLLGDIAARREPSEVAVAATHYRQTLSLAEELGMRPLQAHCHRGLGALYAATGQREQARTALATAIEMYRAMDMTFWLPQTEAALAQVDAR